MRKARISYHSTGRSLDRRAIAAGDAGGDATLRRPSRRGPAWPAHGFVAAARRAVQTRERGRPNLDCANRGSARLVGTGAGR